VGPLQERIEELWSRVEELSPADSDAAETVTEAVDLLDRGAVRVAETGPDGRTVVNEWLKKAILLLFRLRELETMDVGPFEFVDKLPLKRDFARAPIVRYRIEVGRSQGALPKEIVGAIANEGGIDGRLIGQIHLFDDYSTVELPELPPEILETLKRTRVRQQPLRIRPAKPGEGEKPRAARRPAVAKDEKPRRR